MIDSLDENEVHAGERTEHACRIQQAARLLSSTGETTRFDSVLVNEGSNPSLVDTHRPPEVKPSNSATMSAPDNGTKLGDTNTHRPKEQTAAGDVDSAEAERPAFQEASAPADNHARPQTNRQLGDAGHNGQESRSLHGEPLFPAGETPDVCECGHEKKYHRYTFGCVVGDTSSNLCLCREFKPRGVK